MSELPARRRRVLVTGADGLIGRIVRERLHDRFELRSLTRKRSVTGGHVADIAKLEAIEPAFAGVDAVVHLAATSSVESDWEDVLGSNIIGTYNVLEAARRAGVPHVVFASSNHATGMYEVEAAPGVYDLDDGRTWDADVPVRPDSLYGVSKVFGEALGRMYVDRFGMRVICLRIGGVLPDDDPGRPRAPGRPFAPLPDMTAEENARRVRAVWLSHRDCAELIRLALETDRSWAVVYGISDNPRKLWDLASARNLLGFVPRDAARLEPRG